MGTLLIGFWSPCSISWNKWRSLRRGVIPKHLNAVMAKLIEAGVDVQTSEDAIRVKVTSRISPVGIRTSPYPGFPTDLQPLAMVLLTKAQGSSIIYENVFGGRYKLVDELKRMGARIKVEGRTAVIDGGEELSGAPVRATDLRAGAALLVAGLAAKGETVLSGIDHVYRGVLWLLGLLTAKISVPSPVR